MLRKTPLRRDAEKARLFQRRGTPLKRGGPIKRTGQHKINGAVREAVKGRSGGFCEARIVCRGADYQHIHHKLMRSQGGPRQRPKLHRCLLCLPSLHPRSPGRKLRRRTPHPLDRERTHRMNLDEIKARWAKATPGPWRMYGIEYDCWSACTPDGCKGHESTTRGGLDGPSPDSEHNLGSEMHFEHPEDAEAIAHAPKDIAALIERIETLEGALRPFAKMAPEPEEGIPDDAPVAYVHELDLEIDPNYPVAECPIAADFIRARAALTP